MDQEEKTTNTFEDLIGYRHDPDTIPDSRDKPGEKVKLSDEGLLTHCGLRRFQCRKLENRVRTYLRNLKNSDDTWPVRAIQAWRVFDDLIRKFEMQVTQSNVHSALDAMKIPRSLLKNYPEGVRHSRKLTVALLNEMDDQYEEPQEEEELQEEPTPDANKGLVGVNHAEFAAYREEMQSMITSRDQRIQALEASVKDLQKVTNPSRRIGVTA